VHINFNSIFNIYCPFMTIFQMWFSFRFSNWLVLYVFTHFMCAACFFNFERK